MGGDFAPRATVAGALLAVRELEPAHSVILVGRTAVGLSVISTTSDASTT